MSSMLRKDLFVLRHVLWLRSHLTDPVINNVRDLALPREAIYHFLDPDGVVLGPRRSDPLMQKVEGLIYIDHLTEYHKPEITPIRKMGTNISSMVNEYRTANRTFRRMLNPTRNGADPKALLIWNYSLVSAAFGFPRSARADWYQFQAQISTLIHNINKVSRESPRDHYFIVELSDSLPVLSDLVTIGRDPSNTNLRKLSTFEDRFVFELFRWLGRFHDKSSFKELDTKNLKRVNIIFKRLDSWMVLNLAWISQFTKALDPKSLYEPKTFETIFVKLLNDLQLAGRPFTVPTQAEIDDTDDPDLTPEETPESDTSEPTEVERKELETLDINKLIQYDDVDDDEVGYSDEELAELERELLEMVPEKDPNEEREIIELDDEELELLGGVYEEEPMLNLDVFSEITGFDTEVNASVRLAGELNSTGTISNAEFRRIERIANKFSELKDPYDSSKLIVDQLINDIQEIELDEVEGIDEVVLLDKSLGRAKIDEYESTYTEKFLNRDLMRSVAAIQRGPVSVTDYTVEVNEDSQNKFETHRIKIVPVVGRPSTITQHIPVVESDGTFKYNGTQYRMKMQRTDMPIRKISDTVVALNSYYGKLFVELNKRAAQDYTGKFVKWVKSKVVDINDPDFIDGSINDVHVNVANIPLIYGDLAKEIEHFTIRNGNIRVSFNHAKRLNLIPSGAKKEEQLKVVDATESKGYTLFARRGSELYYLDRNGLVWHQTADDFSEIGGLESFLGLDLSEYNLPPPQVGMKIYSKVIPIGFCLAYLVGLERLLEVLKVKFRRVNMGERPNVGPDEYALRFRNQTLVFRRSDVLHTMILSGLNEYSKYIKDYDIGLFETKDVYNAIVDRLGLGNRYMKKLSSISIYFIDPITEQILEMMGEPTEFNPLILRACEMLVTAYVPTEAENARASAKSLSRLRGYDRIAGFAYEQLVKAIESHNMKPNSGRSAITIRPHETMDIIRSDPTVAPVDSLNPVQFLREREVVTHTGRGGRNKRSMVARTRVYQPEDVGVISEATVDSGDVGVIAYASPDANVRSVYGTSGAAQPGDKVDSAKLLSTAALLAPNADGDDPKRISFISVQGGHGIQAQGYEVQPLRTGVERSMVHRMNSTFAQVAHEDGKVTEITDTHVTVQHPSGIRKYEIGNKIVVSAGNRYPNEIVTTALKVGHRYKKGDCVTYNKGFFTPNPLEPNKVDYMSGCLARVALREAPYTLEDSCSISQELAERLKSTSSEPQWIRVNFDENIHNLVKVGQRVNIGDPLCLVEDPVSAGAGIFNEETRKNLALLNSHAPPAKVSGVVSSVEIHYKGDPDFMSESLQKVTKSLESVRRKRARALDQEFIPNLLADNIRMGGSDVASDQAVILIHIDAVVAAGIGDKLVFGNQGKSTIGEVLSGNTRTQDGTPIDSIFGAKSFIDRIITSPFKNGFCNSYLIAVGEVAYEMWTSK